MLWKYIGYIADVLGIISFLLSVGIIRKIYAKTEAQKETYRRESVNLLENLVALRQNIWDDDYASVIIQDKLQTSVFEFQMKYLFISSFRCIFHAFRCTYLLKEGINESNKQKIHNDVNFLIARLSKKE